MMHQVIIRVNDVSETSDKIMQLIDLFKRYGIESKDSIATHFHGYSLKTQTGFQKLIDLLSYGDRGFVEHWISHSFGEQIVHQVKYMDKRRNSDFSYAFIVETPDEMIAVELKLALC